MRLVIEQDYTGEWVLWGLGKDGVWDILSGHPSYASASKAKEEAFSALVGGFVAKINRQLEAI